MVEHVTCGYGKEPIIKDISFQVEEGECLSILGPNGCGKTTLLRGISGILKSQGRVEICGQNVLSLSPRQKALRMAFMSQLSSVYFSYTVYETVMLGRYAHQKKGAFYTISKEDKRIVEESLKRTDMLSLKDRLITELSGGQLQRVFLARVFAQEPQIILLDEPTNHLDLKYQVELMAALKEWVKQGERCVVGVLHDVNLALDFADRVLLMEQGKTKAIEKVEKLDLSLISETYGMDVSGYMKTILKRWE